MDFRVMTRPTSPRRGRRLPSNSSAIVFSTASVACSASVDMTSTLLARHATFEEVLPICSGTASCRRDAEIGDLQSQIAAARDLPSGVRPDAVEAGRRRHGRPTDADVGARHTILTIGPSPRAKYRKAVRLPSQISSLKSRRSGG